MVPDPPIEYLLYQYRLKMGISYQEMLATPWHVIQDDISMMNLATEYQPAQVIPQQNQDGQQG